jgi:hypothetical protein
VLLHPQTNSPLLLLLLLLLLLASGVVAAGHQVATARTA